VAGGTYQDANGYYQAFVIHQVNGTWEQPALRMTHVNHSNQGLEVWVSSTITGVPPPVPCFKEGTLVLTDTGYRPVQDLRKGHRVKTYQHGFQPIHAIGKRDIVHPASPKDQLYRCTHPEVFGDLVLTGCHSILVPCLKDEAQWKQTETLLGEVYQTDDLFRLPACLDEQCVVYDTPGIHTIWHLALEHPNKCCNYGVYANGLLVETCSQRYIKELSGMELIE
jgi:hypothetical protein